MKTSDHMNIKEWTVRLLDTAATLVKVMLLSRVPGKAGKEGRGRRIVVMGNGPSLRQTIDRDFNLLMGCDRMAVNFAANAPEFRKLRPSHYILADPHFFRGYESDGNVRALWSNLMAVDWPMTLHLPAGSRGRVPEGVSLSSSVRVRTYNLTPGEGFGAVVYPLFDAGLAMPRPRNVMIPAIMESIRDGYQDITLVGADHTWHQSLWVDEENRVVSVQPQFYKEGSGEQARVRSEYAGYHLHDIFRSMMIAFRSYHEIAGYASSRGVKIYNATPGSMIDAFPRRALES